MWAVTRMQYDVAKLVLKGEIPAPYPRGIARLIIDLWLGRKKWHEGESYMAVAGGTWSNPWKKRPPRHIPPRV